MPDMPDRQFQPSTTMRGLARHPAIRLYLLPTGLLQGNNAAEALAAGQALPFLGRPTTAFSSVEVTLRAEGKRASQWLPVAALPAWSRSLDERLVTALEQTLTRLTSPRQAFAGLSLDRPRLMGVVNVTPDSFSDGGCFHAPEAAIAQGLALLEAGAEILDIGGESTRPGAAPVPEEEECARVVPVIQALAARGALISIDTRKASVMRSALAAGARIVNDVTALEGDGESEAVVRETQTPVVLMHMQGEPQTMQAAPSYDHVLLDLYDYFDRRLEALLQPGAAGGSLSSHAITLDPGIGFGKTLAHNLDLMARLSLFHGLGCPLLLGVSRKSFIARVVADSPDAAPPPEQRLPGSLAAALAGVNQGAHILRVHDVAETAQALAIRQAIAGVAG